MTFSFLICKMEIKIVCASQCCCEDKNLIMLVKYISQCLSNSSHLIDGSYYYYFLDCCNTFLTGLPDSSLSSCTTLFAEPKQDNQLTYPNLLPYSGAIVILHASHLLKIRQWVPIAYSRGRPTFYVKGHIVNILRLCGSYVLCCHYSSLPLYRQSLHRKYI